MAAGSITRAICIALILRYIGGSPLRGAMNVFANKLAVARKVGFGGLGGVLDTLAGGGLAAVFQDPIGALQSAVTGSISGAVSDLTSHFATEVLNETTGLLGQHMPADVKALVDGLGKAGEGLFGAVEALGNVTGALSGVRLPGDTEFGLMDLLGIANDAPQALFDAAAGPLAQLTRITDAHQFVGDVAQKVITGLLDPADALAVVTDHSDAFTGAVAGSANAFAALRAFSEPAALVQEAAAALMDEGLGGRARAIVESVVKPAPLAAMQQAVHDWTHPPEDEDED